MLIAYGQELLKYSFGQNHPFNHLRVQTFFDNLYLNSENKLVKPKMAEKDEISLFHEINYINLVINLSEKGTGYLDYGDTPAFKHAYEASSYVVGTTLDLTNSLINNVDNYAFNPVGGLHHAMRGQARGFCIFNDIGVGIEFLYTKGYQNILYIDIDAHHGDGVYYPFEEDKRLFIWDVHEDGRFLFPGTGKDSERGKGLAIGTKFNHNLLPGSGDKELLSCLPVLENIYQKNKPDFTICQVGVDGLQGDPLTNLRYSPDGYLEVIKHIHNWSLKYSTNKILFLGGGGYNLNNIKIGWNGIINYFIGVDK